MERGRGPVLVIMAKEPAVGRTKTRLCPPLTLQEAAEFYQAMLWDTITLAWRVKGVQLAIAVTPPEAGGALARLAPDGTVVLPVDGAHI